GLFARLQFGLAPRLLFGGALAILLVATAAVFLLEPLAVEALLFQPLVLCALERGLRLLLGFAQALDFLLLMARLILEHFALHIGALAAHLDVDRAGAPLRACQLQLRLRLAPQRDLARRSVGLCVIAP